MGWSQRGRIDVMSSLSKPELFDLTVCRVVCLFRFENLFYLLLAGSRSR